ncbi:MAG: alpha/beta hydrolase [Chloroflexi bacterium]|nr:alpha/beta hydrolase [Chloroflexota bacterium]
MQTTINGTSVYYEERGSGLPVVILHGFSLDHESMLNVFEPLFAGHDGYRRLYLDMPGHGRTAGTDALCSSQAIAQTILAFLDVLAPDQPIALVGFSYGGHIARLILKACLERIVGLCLIALPVESGPGIRDLPEPRVIVRDPAAIADLPEEVASSILPTLCVQTRPVLDRIRAELVDTFGRGDPAFQQRLRESPTYAYAPESVRLPAPYDRPTLILTGRHDVSTGFAGAFDLARKFPRATYAALDGAGHGLFFEQAALFRALVLDWLDRVALARADIA